MYIIYAMSQLKIWILGAVMDLKQPHQNKNKTDVLRISDIMSKQGFEKNNETFK